MLKGHSKLAHQYKQYGFYAEIVLEVRKIEKSELLVLNDFNELPDLVKYSLRIAFDFFRRNSKYNGLELKLIDIGINPIDSDIAIVAIVIYQALCDAFELSDIKEMLYFDTNNNSAVFSRFPHAGASL